MVNFIERKIDYSADNREALIRENEELRQRMTELEKQVQTYESLAAAASKYMRQEEILENYYTPFVNIVKHLKTDKDRIEEKEYFTLSQWLERKNIRLNSQQKTNFQIVCATVFGMIRGFKPPKQFYDRKEYEMVFEGSYIYSSDDSVMIQSGLEAVFDIVGGIDPEIQDKEILSVPELIDSAGFEQLSETDYFINGVETELNRLIQDEEIPNHRAWRNKFYKTKPIQDSVRYYLTRMTAKAKKR